MSEQIGTLTRYDDVYATYQTADLNDARIPAFIQALTQSKPVSFKGKVYLIRRILMCEDQTIIVLKALKVENKNQSAPMVKE